MNLTNATGTIFVVRHGEKNIAGTHLNETGQMRAQFLKSLWGYSGRFSSPKRIFANFFHEEYNSVELVEPLAKSLHLVVNSSFNRGDNFRAAGAILSELTVHASPILVAWEHKHIVRLLVDMGCARPWLEKWWSTHWPRTDFDEIFMLSFGDGACLNVGIAKENFPLNLKQDIFRPVWSCMLIFMLILCSSLVLVVRCQKKTRQDIKFVAERGVIGSDVNSPLLGA